MFDANRFGQYIPGDSLIHRLDPRVKIISLILYITVLLSLSSSQAIIILLLLVLFMAKMAGLGIKEIWGSLKPLLPILAFAFFLNLFIPGENDTIIFEWSFLRISRESFISAWIISARVAALVLFSNLFLTLTTSAMQLTDGVSNLMGPLRHLGVPVEDIAMMMSIALRFVPVLMEETDKIMKAQSSRGADYDTGGLVKRIRGFVTVLVPLFISSFRRADALAQAMEARAYRSGMKRGKLRPLTLERKDIIFFVTFTLVLLALFPIESRFFLS